MSTEDINSTDDVIIHTASEFCGPETNCVTDIAKPPPPSSSSPHWGLLTLSVIPVWIVLGNGLVLLALLLQRNLQNMSNRVIASLAVTDFLLALVVVPLSIYQLVRASPHSQYKLLLEWVTDERQQLANIFYFHHIFIALFLYCM